MTRHASRTLYVGNLPGDTREKDVDDIFYKYGPILEIDLKMPPRPPGYAFVEFEDTADAEDAMHGRDGYLFDGHRLRVEFAHGGRGNTSTDRYSSYGGGRGYSSTDRYSSGSRSISRYSDYRVMVTGLPSSASWQDLKDHMRRAGDVMFSQVFRDRYGVYGIVDYANYEDMRYAIKKLDDSKFKNAFSSSYVRVKEYGSKSSSPRSGSRSPYSPRSRSRSASSRSYAGSPRRASRSRSRSLSPGPKGNESPGKHHPSRSPSL